jgi:hypothetical protein
VIPRTFKNEDVLTALIRLSGGANFSFDEQAWQYWLDAQNKQSTPDLNARRNDR